MGKNLVIRIEAGSLNTINVTGVGYYTASLIEAMSNISHADVDIFSLHSQSNAMSAHTRHLSLRSRRVVSWLNQRIYRKLYQYLVVPPCDLTLPHADITIFPDFALWPTIHSALNGVVIHDLTFINHPEFMRSRRIGPIVAPVTTWYLRSVVRKSVRRADFIITVSESVKSELIATFNIAADKIIVTPIPPRDEFLSQKGQPQNLTYVRNKYHIPTPNYILSVGTIEPRKNHLALLIAYLRLPENIRKTHSLVIAGGDGWGSEKTLQAIHDAQKAGENVILTGYFNNRDAYALYQHATIFSSASHYEGFGMPLLEAMYARTPLLLSNIPVFREVSGSAAMYVNTQDINAYSSSMLELIESPTLRKKLVSLGDMRLRQFSWNTNAEKIQEVCTRMLHTKK